MSIEVLVFMLRVPKVGYFDEKSAKLCGQRSGIRGRMWRHITDLSIHRYRKQLKMRIVISAIIHYKVNFLGFKYPNVYTLPPKYVSETHTKNLGRFNKEKIAII